MFGVLHPFSIPLTAPLRQNVDVLYVVAGVADVSMDAIQFDTTNDFGLLIQTQTATSRPFQKIACRGIVIHSAN
jgi:hypothetical protein